MFDIGWLELLVIGIVALIVVGPKDLPGMFRTVGNFVGKARGMAREFQRSMEAAADESGLKEATDTMKGLDPIGQAQNSMKDYAKNFTTLKDQKEGEKTAGEALVEEASKVASPAAKATAPAKDAAAGAAADAPKAKAKPKPKATAAKKPAKAAAPKKASAKAAASASPDAAAKS